MDTTGVGVGAIAGLIGILPFFVVFAFASVGLIVSVPGQAASAAVVLLAIGIVATLVYYVGLSVLGGFVGRWIRER
ncbi:MAG: hypothetical protein BRD24_02715 [Halobacteriales archaeon SW_9_67_24]|nr:MAG: hypothetical protein BRD24_02715 [Halobacteriales archaeon SW_9_67_24]